MESPKSDERLRELVALRKRTGQTLKKVREEQERLRVKKAKKKKLAGNLCQAVPSMDLGQRELRRKASEAADENVNHLGRECDEIAAVFERIRLGFALEAQGKSNEASTADKYDALIGISENVGQLGRKSEKEINEPVPMNKDMAEAGESREESAEERQAKINCLWQEFVTEGLVTEASVQSKFNRMWGELQEMQEKEIIRKLEQLKAKLLNKRKPASS